MRKWLPFTTACIGSGFLFYSFNHSPLHLLHYQKQQNEKVDIKKKYIRLEELKSHNELSKRIWVSYKKEVFDVTDFVSQHPGLLIGMILGGNKILLAAGKDLEPFWKVFTIHQNPQVYSILKAYKIGELDPDEKQEELVVKVENEFSKDPDRSPLLDVRSQQPFNAETPPALLTDYLTPIDIFYVRNHLPVPLLEDLEQYKLVFEAEGQQMHEFNYEELFQNESKSPALERYQMTATLQCAGNRRSEMNVVEQTAGLQWKNGAIGNQEFEGISLLGLFYHLGWTPSWIRSQGYQHVQIEGMDGYAASFPVQKLFQNEFLIMEPEPITEDKERVVPGGGVLLADKMGKQTLTRDHGFPVRLIVPGHVAARSVKWVQKIKLSKDESSGHWQQKDYRPMSPSTNWNNIPWVKCESIQEMPVTSAILSPTPEEKVKSLSFDEIDSDHLPDNFEQKDFEEKKFIKVTGYAWSGGGRDIQRVDVSLNQGKTWFTAHMQKTKQEKSQAWAWTQWQVYVPVADQKEATLVCKAVDSSCQSQPDSFAPIYNKRGLLSNAWHQLKFEIIN